MPKKCCSPRLELKRTIPHFTLKAKPVWRGLFHLFAEQLTPRDDCVRGSTVSRQLGIIAVSCKCFRDLEFDRDTQVVVSASLRNLLLATLLEHWLLGTGCSSSHATVSTAFSVLSQTTQPELNSTKEENAGTKYAVLATKRSLGKGPEGNTQLSTGNGFQE